MRTYSESKYEVEVVELKAGRELQGFEIVIEANESGSLLGKCRETQMSLIAMDFVMASVVRIILSTLSVVW